MAHADAYVVIAEFEVKPSCMTAFLDAAHDDAHHSLNSEPGCQRFDVVRLPGSQHVLFYELYDDQRAFELHLQTPHLKRFQARFPELVLRELPVRLGALHRHLHGGSP